MSKTIPKHSTLPKEISNRTHIHFKDTSPATSPLPPLTFPYDQEATAIHPPALRLSLENSTSSFKISKSLSVPLSSALSSFVIKKKAKKSLKMNSDDEHRSQRNSQVAGTNTAAREMNPEDKVSSTKKTKKKKKKSKKDKIELGTEHPEESLTTAVMETKALTKTELENSSSIKSSYSSFSSSAETYDTAAILLEADTMDEDDKDEISHDMSSDSGLDPISYSMKKSLKVATLEASNEITLNSFSAQHLKQHDKDTTSTKDSASDDVVAMTTAKRIKRKKQESSSSESMAEDLQALSSSTSSRQSTSIPESILPKKPNKSEKNQTKRVALPVPRLSTLKKKRKVKSEGQSSFPGEDDVDQSSEKEEDVLRSGYGSSVTKNLKVDQYVSSFEQPLTGHITVDPVFEYPRSLEAAKLSSIRRREAERAQLNANIQLGTHGIRVPPFSKMGSLSAEEQDFISSDDNQQDTATTHKKLRQTTKEEEEEPERFEPFQKRKESLHTEEAVRTYKTDRSIRIQKESLADTSSIVDIPERGQVPPASFAAGLVTLANAAVIVSLNIKKPMQRSHETSQVIKDSTAAITTTTAALTEGPQTIAVDSKAVFKQPDSGEQQSRLLTLLEQSRHLRAKGEFDAKMKQLLHEQAQEQARHLQTMDRLWALDRPAIPKPTSTEETQKAGAIKQATVEDDTWTQHKDQREQSEHIYNTFPPARTFVKDVPILALELCPEQHKAFETEQYQPGEIIPRYAHATAVEPQTCESSLPFETEPIEQQQTANTSLQEDDGMYALRQDTVLEKGYPQASNENRESVGEKAKEKEEEVIITPPHRSQSPAWSDPGLAWAALAEVGEKIYGSEPNSSPGSSPAHNGGERMEIE
ncbi:hypothetical protein BGZ83_006990 [Gryganskiella cystojenkinii]|nr:hypothetical protein BGZ83_006990 [Gryganskiella cystojenkinii]